ARAERAGDRRGHPAGEPEPGGDPFHRLPGRGHPSCGETPRREGVREEGRRKQGRAPASGVRRRLVGRRVVVTSAIDRAVDEMLDVLRRSGRALRIFTTATSWAAELMLANS